MSRYYCTVCYRTPSGVPSQFSVTVRASDSTEAMDKAIQKCGRARRVHKLDGGTVHQVNGKGKACR